MPLSADEYLKLAEEEDRAAADQERERAQLALQQARKVDPEAYAQDMVIGRAIGAPMLPSVLHADPSVVATIDPVVKTLPGAQAIKDNWLAGIGRLKTDTALQNAPRLTRWLTADPSNARISHDDIDRLAMLEQDLGVASLEDLTKRWATIGETVQPGAEPGSLGGVGETIIEGQREVGTALPRGAARSIGGGLRLLGLMMRSGTPELSTGGAANLLADQLRDEVPDLAQKILGAKSMSPEELEALRAEIFQQGDVNPALAQNILSGVLDGSMPIEEAALALEPAFKGLTQQLREQAKALTESGAYRSRNNLPDPYQPRQVMGIGLKLLSQWLGGEQQTVNPNAASDRLLAAGDSVNEWTERVLGADPEWADNDIVQTAEALGQIMTMVAAGLMGRTAGGMATVIMGGSELPEQARQDGQDITVQQAVAPFGLAIGLTEFLPIERFLDAPYLKANVETVVQALVKSGLYEGGQEVLQQSLNDVVAAAVYGGAGSLQELWESFKIGGYAGMATTAVQLLIGRYAPRLAGRRFSNADLEANKNFFEGLTKGVTTSTVRARMPAKFKEFVEQVTKDGPVENLYVPGREFVAYFQGYGIDKVAEELGLDPTQILIAAETGGDVVLPTANWASSLAGTEHDAFILDNARLEGDGYTLAEARDINANIRTILDEARRIVDEDVTQRGQRRTEAEALTEVMATRIMEGGRYAPDVARRQALLFVKNLEATAEQAGLPVTELFQRFGLPQVRSQIGTGQSAVPRDTFERMVGEIRSRRARGESTPAVEAGTVDAVPPTADTVPTPEGMEAPPAAEAVSPAPTATETAAAAQPAARSRRDEILDRVEEVLDAAGVDLDTMSPEEILARVEEWERTPEAAKVYAQPGVNLMDNPLPVTPTGGTKGTKITVKDIARAFHDHHMETIGRKLFPETSAEDFAMVLGWARDEMTSQLQRPNSGVGWYSADVELAIRVAAKIYPTLLTNREHRQIYLTFAGLFSSGLDPDQAFLVSSIAFDGFLSSGRIPVTRTEAMQMQGKGPETSTFKSDATGEMVTKEKGWSPRSQGNEQQLAFLQWLVDREGSIDAAMKWLLTQRPRTEINDAMLASGHFNTPRWTTKKDKAGKDEYGFLVLGEKLGRYSLGLHGVEIDAGDTTVDLWYTRSFRRWTGRLFDPPIGNEGIAAQPANPAERDAVFRLTEALGAEYSIPPGDVQAVLWFWEKRLWGAHGLRINEGTNSSGALKLAAQRGIEVDPDPILREITGRDLAEGSVADRADGQRGAVYSQSYDPRAPGDGGGGPQAGGLAPLPGAPQVAGAAGPDPRLASVAQAFAQERGIDLKRQAVFAEVDEDRARRIAQAYEEMADAPDDPEVRAAYADMIRQTVDQYRALEAAGYRFYFYDGDSDPYDLNPWNAMRDLRANQRMGVFATSAGYGTGAQINIGLADPDGGADLTPDQVLRAFEAAGIEVQQHAQHTSDSEPTLVVRVKQALTKEQGDRLSAALNQEAIAQRTDDEAGDLFGPMADQWGPYNPDYFLTMEGKRASAVANPLLALTDVVWPYGSPDGPPRPVTANDLFRAVHDAFGHGMEGAGFRARGEENAWQAHVRLFTGPGARAMTSETRGQNSWLNYGPHGEANRTAGTLETVFAPQKIGLLPEWVMTEGRVPDEGEVGKTYAQTDYHLGRFRALVDELRLIEQSQAPVTKDHGRTQPDHDDYLMKQDGSEPELLSMSPGVPHALSGTAAASSSWAKVRAANPLFINEADDGSRVFTDANDQIIDDVDLRAALGDALFNDINSPGMPGEQMMQDLAAAGYDTVVGLMDNGGVEWVTVSSADQIVPEQPAHPSDGALQNPMSGAPVEFYWDDLAELLLPSSGGVTERFYAAPVKPLYATADLYGDWEYSDDNGRVDRDQLEAKIGVEALGKIEGHYVMDDAMKEVHAKSGYDAVVWRTYDPTDPDPITMVKLLDKGAMRPIMGAPGTGPGVERRPLVVVHNVREDKLRETLKLYKDSIPMPSLAVTPADDPLGNFGNITFVGGSDLVDAQLDPRNKVYGGDIYSPRHPKMQTAFDAKQLTANFSAVMMRGSPPPELEFHPRGTSISQVLNYGDEKFAVETLLSSNLGLMWTRAKDLGLDPSTLVVTKTRQVAEWIEMLPESLRNEFLAEAEAFERRVGYFDAIDFLDEFQDYNDELTSAFEQMVEYMTRKRVRELVDALQIEPTEAIEGTERSLVREEFFGRDGGQATANPVKVTELYQTLKGLKEQGRTYVDYDDTRMNLLTEIAMEAGKQNVPADNSMRDELLDGVTTASYRDAPGTPVTAENTVDLMLKANQGKVRNKESGGNINGLVNLRAAVTPHFETVEAIQLWRDRLEAGNTWENSKSQFSRRHSDVREAVKDVLGVSPYDVDDKLAAYAETNPITDTTAFEDIFLADATWDQNNETLTRVRPSGASNMKRLTAGQMADIRDKVDGFLADLATMPTEYLEAKPERVVKLSEFKAVVVREGTLPDDLRQTLEGFGLEIVEHRSGSDSRRLALKAAAAAGGYLFQTKPAGGARGQIEFPALGIGGGETVIRLFEGANLSTMLHEGGHWFLTMRKALAEDPTLPADSPIKQDWEKLRAWWRAEAAAVAKDANRANANAGVTEADVIAALDNGTTGDAVKDSAIDVGMQEQFARGFEAYLMEGRAPSPELRSAFAAFRSWLVAIYNSIRALDVNLTDEVRGVMDRMVATKDEIDAAQRQVAGDPLFKTAAEMGLSEAAYRELTDLHQQARDESERRLLKKFMAPLVKQRTAEYREAKAGVTAEVTALVNAEPVYRAWEWLANRRWLGGEQPGEMPDMRMSKALLVDRFGEEILGKLPRGQRGTIYAVDGGMDPDEVAGWFGFESGDELIRALQDAPRRSDKIDELVAKRMADEYPDPLRDGSAEREAVEALHNDVRARFLQAELDALFKRMGQKGSPSTLSMAREVARQAIAALPVRRVLNTATWLRAERQAGYDAQKALAGGDVEAAAEAKRRQLLNHQLWIEAKRIEAEVGKIERMAKSLQKPSARARLAGTYLEPIDEILARYDFRKMSRAREAGVVEARATLRGFIDQMVAAGRENELAIPDFLIEDSKRTPYQMLTVEKLLGVGDALRNIRHMARQEKKLLDEQAAREMDDVVADIEQAFGDNITPRPPSRGEPGTGEVLRTGLQKYLNLSLTADTLLNEVDGFAKGSIGKVYAHIKKPIDIAMGKLVTRRMAEAENIEKLYAPYARRERQRMAKPEHHAVLGGSFSRWELITMALNMGNEANLERLTNPKVKDAFGRQQTLTEAQVDYVKRTLDERDWQFVQSVWDYLDGMWPEISAREKRVTGVTPKRVTPMPVETPFGRLRGGYYPIKYDGRLARRVVDMNAETLAREAMGGAHGKAHTPNGHTKDRVGSTNLPLAYDIGVLNQHVNSVLHDLYLSEVVTNAGRILSDGRVRSLFTSYGRQDDLDTLDVWLLDTASGQIAKGDIWNRGVRRLRSGWTVSKLAFSAATVATQVTGLTQAAVVVGKRNFVAGLGDYVKNPAISRSIMQRSPFMRERMGTFQKDIMDTLGDLKKAGPLQGAGSRLLSEYLVPAGMWAMVKVQFHAVDVPTWIAAYRQATRDGQSEADAAHYADRMVARAAASGIFSDRSAIERGSLSKDVRQVEGIRIFTALASYLFAKTNVAYTRIRETNYRNPLEVLNLAADLTLIYAVEGALVQIIKGAWPDDEDDEDGDGLTDEWLKMLAREGVMAAAAGLPGIRDVSSAFAGFGGGGAYQGIVETFSRFGFQLYQAAEDPEEQLDKGLAKATSNMAGMLLMLPSAQFNRSVIDTLATDDPTSPMEFLMGDQSKR